MLYLMYEWRLVSSVACVTTTVVLSSAAANSDLLPCNACMPCMMAASHIATRGYQKGR
jgi:hypothetical protein